MIIKLVGLMGASEIIPPRRRRPVLAEIDADFALLLGQNGMTFSSLIPSPTEGAGEGS
jgi:hypothetical protein